MAPSPSPPSTAAHSFSSSDPGFEALPLIQVLALHQGLLARIKLCFGADRATFERDLLPLIQGYAGFVHLLPATAGNYFHTPGGLLQLGLEAAFFSLQGTDAHIFSGRSTISERRELEPRWRVATFIGGLCCELHRVLSHLIVTTADGEEWPAFLGGLAPWLKSQGADRYFVRWRANARESRGLGLFALPHVVPAMVLQMLGSGNAVIVPQLMASIGGVPQHREHNVLDELVRRSLALVIDRNLLASADRYGKPQYGSHLERYLVDALRRLAAGHSAWAVNRDKSRVWLGPEGLFLVWPGAAEDVLALLENDQLVGIPKSPQTLLELLLEAGVLVAAEAARQTWAIQPPGAKAPMEAVKLTSAAILLAGLEPPPCALEASLLPPPSDSKAQSPAPPAATPTPAAPAAPKVAPSSAPGASGIQLLLIDPPAEKTAHDPALLNAASPNEAGTPTAPLQPTPTRPAVKLQAPLRLNPAVRTALGDIVAGLGDGTEASDISTVAEGIFIPLTEFERRGIQPGTAIRALDDARMILRPPSGGLSTVCRQIRDTTVLGIVLMSTHVEGIDQHTFALANASESTGPSGPRTGHGSR
ncbi:MAG TPA: relaxase [Comamonadaceae bacterium]|nr:TraI domain-containing protein [Burkholderiaceae bacterium]OGB45607.1 MAG: relaxase [Burkholderiales bacterium RIFCSPLOWO2_12_FULL_65_40]HCE27655.1 relaxase [Comamonadaceae bacterium]